MSDFYESALLHQLNGIFYWNSEEDRKKQEQEIEEQEEKKNRHSMFEGGQNAREKKE